MKLFEWSDRSMTRSALARAICSAIAFPTRRSWILRNNSIFTFGQADRARTSATYREILDAMWLFNAKFEEALARFDAIKARQKG